MDDVHGTHLARLRVLAAASTARPLARDKKLAMSSLSLGFVPNPKFVQPPGTVQVGIVLDQGIAPDVDNRL